jgi:putative transposase
MANRPPRLTEVFEAYARPVWFVTFNTANRAQLLANIQVHDAFQEFCSVAAGRDIWIGRYVLMPDHVHLFVAGTPTFELAGWVRLLKMALSRVIPAAGPHWQEGFFDHLLRKQESYAQKWDYVRQNPVRAGLVASPDDWPFQGEVNRLSFE